MSELQETYAAIAPLLSDELSKAQWEELVKIINVFLRVVEKAKPVAQAG